jgi:hypothetical protein
MDQNISNKIRVMKEDLSTVVVVQNDHGLSTRLFECASAHFLRRQIREL